MRTDFDDLAGDLLVFFGVFFGVFGASLSFSVLLSGSQFRKLGFSFCGVLRKVAFSICSIPSRHVGIEPTFGAGSDSFSTVFQFVLYYLTLGEIT